MSIVEALHAKHKARLATIARAAEHPKQKHATPAASYEIPNTPFGVPKLSLVERPPFDPDAEWIARQRLIPIPQPPKDPWFCIVEGPREFEQKAPPTIKIDHIQRIVCEHYDISREEMNSPRRIANLVRPRQIAVYLCKTLTSRSLPEIGRHFGNRDHTTILHAVRKFAILVAKDPVLALEIEILREKCKA